MERIVGFFKKTKLSYKELFLFSFILCLFLINATYVTYPDEFVNILGGVFINQGKIPYKQYFDHHLPFAWHLASFILLFSFNSYVAFRVIFALLTFGALFYLSSWIKKNHPDYYVYFLAFFFIYPIMAVYFWFHLFLADSLAVLFFSLIFWILIAETYSKKTSFKALTVASFLSFCLIFSSLTFVYLAIILYIWQVYLLIRSDRKKIPVFLLYCIIPYVVYLTYIVITGAWPDFYFSNVLYNTNHYISIPNYTKGRFFNPIKFAMTVIFNFYSDYLPLISKIKDFNLYLPVGILAGLGTLSLLFLLLSNNIIIGVIYFFILSFSAPRSSIKNYNETDYQGSLFLILGLISSLVFLYLAKKNKSTNTLDEDVKRIAQAILMIFLIFTAVFLIGNTYNKFYLRYTQKLYGIYDQSSTSDFFNQVLEKDDYYWIGPYEPQEMFFVKKGKLPGKYPSLLPQFRESDYLKQSFISQFEKNKPKFIIFKNDASIFMTPATEFGRFFMDWLKQDYVSLENISGIEVIKNPTNFNLRTDLYILKSENNTLLERVRDAGYIR